MSFPRYPEYKDSGVDLLGEIPVSWGLKRVKYLLRDGYEGLKIGPFGSQLTSEMLVDEGPYRVYGQENVIADDFERGSRRIDESKFSELSVYEIRSGDVLITMMGTSGRCAVVPNSIELGVMDSHLLRMRLGEDMCPEFLRTLIDESDYVKNQVRLLGKGSIMHGLNSGVVKELFVAMPSAEEQKSILGFLLHEKAKLDSLIEDQERLIALLKEKRQAVISHAVTKGLNPSVPMKDSGIDWIGEVPANWEIGPIKKWFRTTSGGTPDTSRQDDFYTADDGYPWIRTTDLNNGVLTSWEVEITDSAIAATACEMLPIETVLVAMYGGDGTVGKNGILGMSACINQAVCGLLPTSEFNSQYTFWFMQFYRPYWMIGAESSRKDPNISQSLIRNTSVPCPPLAEQNVIASILGKVSEEIDALISEAEQGIILLRERRSALISAAVTGKIDVRNFRKEAA